MRTLQEQNRTLFTDKSLIKLIVPLIIEQTLAMLVGMADGIMVSSVGETAIAGVSLVDMINNIVLTLFAGLATGGVVVTSHYIGAKHTEKAKRSASQVVLLAFISGLGIMALCLALARPIMKLFFGSIDSDVMEMGLLYFRITALSFPFIALYNAGAALFRSQGNSKVSMLVSLLMNFINVAGNATLIYGFKFGVAGVAIPTLVSRAVAAVIILILASKPSCQTQISFRNVVHVHGGMMKNIIRVGIPSAFENCIFQLGRAIVVSMISVFGTSQTSANAVANTIDGVAIIIGQAMSLALVTVVGQCIGAGDTDAASKYSKKILAWVYFYQGIVNIVVALFRYRLVGLYSSLSEETVELAATLILIHTAASFVLWPAAFALPNALRAASDINFTMIVSIASMIIWRVGFSWILCVQMEMGAVGVWIAMTIDWVCRTVMFVTRFANGKWKTKYKES